MSVYRIREWKKGSYIVEKRSTFLFIHTWDHVRGPERDLKAAEEFIKFCLSEDAFRPKIISVWSEKLNGK
jgi:hypothetical protein